MKRTLMKRAVREIERALKYLKNNKATGADSIAAELLKNGGPYLVDALNEVMQHAWTSETLPRSWTKGVLLAIKSYENVKFR
jgi:hypothetical protein